MLLEQFDGFWKREVGFPRGRLAAVDGQMGCVPDALKYPQLQLLSSLYNDVLYQDIAARYHLQAVNMLEKLAFTLISNPSRLVSFNKLQEQFQL